ncbi:MAG TPA: cupredoxin domain-containing protein [Jatrophihabitantaceae bacterium]|nr:cupredoxin domain-containing protein [Jatrophihabitantaceae bacterium]
MPVARFAAAAATAAVAVLAASACSNTQASVNRRPHTGVTTAVLAGGLQVVTVDANDLYRFDPSTIYVHPGRVEIDLVNIGKGAPHDWSLLGFDATTPLTGTGQRSSVTFTAPSPGTYTYVCTIHRKQGQTGTLVVLPD